MFFDALTFAGVSGEAAFAAAANLVATTYNAGRHGNKNQTHRLG